MSGPRPGCRSSPCPGSTRRAAGSDRPLPHLSRQPLRARPRRSRPARATASGSSPSPSRFSPFAAWNSSRNPSLSPSSNRQLGSALTLGLDQSCIPRSGQGQSLARVSGGSARGALATPTGCPYLPPPEWLRSSNSRGCGGHPPPRRERLRAASRACATLAPMRVVIADDHRLMLDGIRRALEPTATSRSSARPSTGTQVLPLVARDEARPRPARRAHAAHGRARLPRRDPQAPSGDQGRDALGLDEPDLDRGRAPPRRVRLRRQERRPGRPARRRSGRRSRATCTRAIGVDGRRATRARKALGLTEREATILGALARGLSNDEIAKEFWVTPADGEVPPHQHLPQARRQEPHRGDTARVPARARREPALRRRIASCRQLLRIAEEEIVLVILLAGFAVVFLPSSRRASLSTTAG